MTLQQFLFSFTFLFGVIHLLTITKLFDDKLRTFFDALVYTKLPPFWNLMGYYVFYLSLFYQIIFWAKFLKVI